MGNMMKDKTPLWTCPRCGHKFVTKNLWHSCGKFKVASHFKDRPENLHQTYRKIVDCIQSLGPATAYAQKTRIVVMRRVRFAGFVVKKESLDFSLWMKRKVDHPAISRVESFGKGSYGAHFKLTRPGQIDGRIKSWIRET